MIQVFSLTVFVCTYNLKLERNSYLNSDLGNSHNGIVLQVGRKLLQVTKQQVILFYFIVVNHLVSLPNFLAFQEICSQIVKYV